MLKRVASRFGIPALLLSAGLALFQPSTAAAADWHDHDGWHNHAYRDRGWRDHDRWRGHEYWEHRSWSPSLGFYFGYTPAPSYVTPAPAYPYSYNGYPYNSYPSYGNGYQYNSYPSYGNGYQYNSPQNYNPSYGYPY
jgi:hypothetical protein